MTIAAIIAQNNSAIRNKTLPKSITKTNVADFNAVIVDELRARGINVAANTAALAGILGTETDKVWVPGTGMFQFNSGGTANGITSFAASGSGTFDLKGVTEGYHSNRKIFHLDKAVSSGIIFDEGGAFDNNFINHQAINVNGGVHAIDFKNLSTGTSAGLGMALRNDTGAFFQLQKGSTNYSIFPAGTLMRDSASGFLWVTPGTHNWGASAAIGSAYATLDATTMNFKTQALKTIQPSANGAGAWKLGKILGGDGAGAASFIEVDIDGVLYVLTAKAKV